MRKTPLVSLTLALIGGILLAMSVEIPLWVWLTLLATASLVGGILLICRREYPVGVVTTLLLTVIFAFGGLRCMTSAPQYDPHYWIRHCQSPSYLMLRLKESPTPRERSWMALADVESVDGRPTRGDLRLFLRKDSLSATLHYGDRLHVHGYVDTTKRMLYTTSDHYILTSRDNTSLRARSERLRMLLLRRLQSGPLERRYAGVAEALTLGWRRDIHPGLQAQFRDAGIMHLLCVSGLHVGLLAVIVGWAMVWVGNERRGRIIRGSVQLLAVWSFVLLTGLAPSSVRAALMFSTFIVSRMMGRRTHSMNLLAAAAFVMLFANPMLLYNVGWQLSFCAVAGILMTQLPKNKNIPNIVKTANASFAATLATLPITLYTFHRIPLYFLIANIVIIPFAGLILGLSILYTMLPCNVIAWPLRWMLAACDWLTAGVAGLPGATLEGLHPTPWMIVLLAVGVFLILKAINRISRHIEHRINSL